MTVLLPLAFLLGLTAVSADAAPASAREGSQSEPSPDWQVAQMTIEQRVIVRIPVRPIERERARSFPPMPMDDRPFEWREHRGPKCQRVREIAGAVVQSDRGVDLVLRDSSRLRARLDRGCRAADFYSGFYIQRTEDGALCAGRDSLLTRSGASCEIDSFRRLLPERR